MELEWKEREKETEALKLHEDGRRGARPWVESGSRGIRRGQGTSSWCVGPWVAAWPDKQGAWAVLGRSAGTWALGVVGAAEAWVCVLGAVLRVRLPGRRDGHLGARVPGQLRKRERSEWGGERGGSGREEQGNGGCLG
jgi:hypothetical protein